MTLELEAILFNDDPVSPARGLNLRRDARSTLRIPEWRRRFSHYPEDSIVGYAVDEARRQAPSIRVALRRTDPRVTRVEIRAVVPPGARNVLGAVRARQVTFLADGSSGFQRFELRGGSLTGAGVGVHTVVWRWERRVPPSTQWTSFAETSHRVYTVLGVPGPPWQQFPFITTNTQVPWVAVLDHACRWAAGAQTVDAASAMITRAVYELGPELVEYGCPVGGGPQYSVPYFHCTAFLERLSGGVGNGRYVNCSDCATIVSTFANIVGCRLWQSGMGMAPFALNAVVAIGGSAWRTACDWGGFTYHEVAWTGGCTEDDNVYDACLQVDGDVDPTRAPHRALLPVRLRFGRPGEGQYRDRLAAPAGRAGCQPLPAIRQHRQVA